MLRRTEFVEVPPGAQRDLAKKLNSAELLSRAGAQAWGLSGLIWKQEAVIAPTGLQRPVRSLNLC